MLIKTLLNKCYPVKGFVYCKVTLRDKIIMVYMKERKGTRALCSQCKRAVPTDV